MKLFKDKYLYITKDKLPEVKKTPNLTGTVKELEKNGKVLYQGCFCDEFVQATVYIIFLNENVGKFNRMEYRTLSHNSTRYAICCDFILVGREYPDKLRGLTAEEIKTLKKLYGEYSMWQMDVIKKEFFDKEKGKVTG